MGYLFPWLGGFAVGYYLLVETWTTIEQPLLELLFLGVVPGTNFIVGFNQALLALSLVILLAALFSYRRRQKTVKRGLIVLSAL